MVDQINKNIRKLPSWLIYAATVGYASWLFYLGLTGGLGVEPINALEREYGITALQLVVLGLAVTPLRRHFGLNLLKHRRAIGVSAFFLVSIHLMVWLFLDVQSLSAIWADIVKRPYITIGMIAFVMMLPLGITSNNWSVRKLGPMWRSLHKLTYAVAILGAVHYVMVAKGFQIEPLIYLGLTALLLVSRWKGFPKLKLA